MNEDLQPTSGATAHHIEIRKTARYFSLGTLSANTREIWFIVHGYGQLAEYFIRHFRGLDDGTRYIIAPEGLSRFYVKEWTRVGATWTTKEDRDTEVADYVAYLQTLETEIWRQFEQKGGKRDSVRVWALGFSQGVTTLCRWIVRGGLRPDRLICWAGDFPAEIDLPTNKDLFERMKTTFVIGSDDEFITPERLAQHKETILKAGLNLGFVGFDGTHVMDVRVLRDVVKSLQ
ncbi:MAG: phospholipase [Candidatus Kapabacteria bacterium]|jgi:predicted esterase|nr:phospholipase [Candidatus Kapabacteria bacterium]